MFEDHQHSSNRSTALLTPWPDLSPLLPAAMGLSCSLLDRTLVSHKSDICREDIGCQVLSYTGDQRTLNEQV